MTDFEIRWTRFDGSKNRVRVDFHRANNMMEALAWANDMARAWKEMAPEDHIFEVTGIRDHSRHPQEEASIGWETSEEWNTRRAEEEANA